MRMRAKRQQTSPHKQDMRENMNEANTLIHRKRGQNRQIILGQTGNAKQGPYTR